MILLDLLQTDRRGIEAMTKEEADEVLDDLHISHPHCGNPQEIVSYLYTRALYERRAYVGD